MGAPVSVIGRIVSLVRMRARALCVAIAAPLAVGGSLSFAANMRDYIEAARAKAAVVYVGVVTKVDVLERGKLALIARAHLRVVGALRGARDTPREAVLRYSSYDDKTPPLEGGPQYLLKPDMWVLAFAPSFDATVPPGYLAFGDKADLVRHVERLRDGLATMPAEAFKVQQIDEAHRKAQLELYDRALAVLKGDNRIRGD